MLSVLLTLAGSYIFFKLFYKGYKLYTPKQNGMTETLTDYKMRRFSGFMIMLLAVAAFIISIKFFNF